MKWLGYICGFLGIALIAYLLLGKPITISFTEDDVRQQVADRLPMKIVKNGITADVDTLDLDFLPDNRIHVDIAMNLSGYGLEGRATGSTTSGLRYDAGDFYLEDLDLSDLDVTPSSQSSAALEDTKSTAKGLWNKFKANHLDDTPDATEAADRLKERVLSRLAPAARELADRALKTTPVYSLNGQDMKMDIAALALVDVRFRAESVEIDLDPRNVILWGLGIALMVAMAGLLSFGIILGGGRGASAGLIG